MEMKDTKPKTKKFAVIGVTTGLLIGAGAGLLMNVSGGASASSATVSTIANSVDTPEANDVPDAPEANDVADAPEANDVADAPEGNGGHEGRGGPEMLAAAADAIGITVTELQTAVKSGQTIAEVAVANGKSVQSVIDALVAQATADITAHITDMVNGIHPVDDDSAGK